MPTMPVKPLLFLLSLACLPLTSNAAPNDGSTSSSVSTKAVIEWYCSPSNNYKFRGHIVGHTVVSSGLSYFQVERYKITRIDGQGGGNRANLNIYMGNRPNFDFTAQSPDNLKQDSQWHNLNLRVNYPSSANAIKFKFIFDTSGTDPSCEVVRPA